jgi:hypothetical protein
VGVARKVALGEGETMLVGTAVNVPGGGNKVAVFVAVAVSVTSSVGVAIAFVSSGTSNKATIPAQ